MKFLCPNCKQKYQISDEKIRGRTLKMNCRRCSHAIVIRGDQLAAEPRRAAIPAAGKGPASAAASPKPRPRASQGSRPQATAAPPSSRPPAAELWHIAINDVPVGPMKRDEVAQKIASGAANGRSLCWREGFDDWRPLEEVPELAPLLRRPHSPPPMPARSLPRGTPEAPRPVRPPTQRALPSRSKPDAARPTAGADAAPLAARLGGAAAPTLDDVTDAHTEDEPTRVGSSLDLRRLEEEERRIAEEERRLEEEKRKEARTHTPTPASEPEAEKQSAPDSPDSPDSPDERAEAHARTTKEPPLTASLAGEDEAFDPFASDRASTPAPPDDEAEPSGASEPAPTPAETAEPAALAASASFAAPAPERRRGLPFGAWVLLAGAMTFGATLAVMVGIKLFDESPTPVVTATGTEPATADTRPMADPELVLPDSEGAAEKDDETLAVEDEGGNAAEQTAPVKAQTKSSGATRPAASTRTPEKAASTNSGSTPRQLTAAEEARLRQFEDDGAGAAPIAASKRNSVLAQDSRGGGGELTSKQVRSVVNRERAMVQRCYETATRAAGQAPSLRIDVDIVVGGSGTVTSATARGPGFGSLNDCIERTVRRWRFPAAGGTSRLSVPFVFQGQD